MGRKMTFGSLMVAAVLISGCGASSENLSPALLKVARPQVRAKGIAYSLYYGSNHTHSAAAGDDGKGTLDEAFSYARDKGKLDFFASSPHSHMITSQGYQALRQTAQKYNQDGKFVTLVGQEWGSLSKGGHVNIFEANDVCQVTSGDWSTLYKQWLPNHPEISWVALNHPHKDDFGQNQIAPLKDAVASKIITIATIGSRSDYEGEDGKSPISEKADTFDYFLNLGYKVAALGEQDNHKANWGTSSPVRTGVWARQLSKTEIVKAFQARRTFSTQVKGLKIWFTLNSNEMGSEGDSIRSMNFSVSFNDPSKETTNLYLYGDLDGPGGNPACTIAQTNVKDGQAEWNYAYNAGKSGKMYFYLRAVSSDGIMAFSSPIWVDVK